MSCYASCLDTPKPCEPCEFESIVRLIFLRRVIMFEEAVELRSWQALTMNSTLTHLFLRLGLAKSNWFENFETPKKTWQGLSSCFNPRVWMRNDRPFVSICHLARCNNFIDDEGAIHLASALETGCAWTRYSFFWSRDSSEAGIIPEATHLSGLRTYWWTSYEFVALFTQSAVNGSVAALRFAEETPIPYFTDLDSISQQSKFHSTDPETIQT